MTLFKTSPRSSGSLRRTLSDAAGLVTLWGWIGARAGLSLATTAIDRVAAFSLRLTSAPIGLASGIDARSLDELLDELADRGGAL